MLHKYSDDIHNIFLANWCSIFVIYLYITVPYFMKDHEQIDKSDNLLNKTHQKDTNL